VIAQPLPSPGTVPQALPLSFAQVYEQYRERIYRYIHRLVSDLELAEDLTQDTFLRAFKALPGMPRDLKLSAWLYRIATNVAYDALRRRRLIAWHPLEELEGEPPNNESDPQVAYNVAELVHLALSRLPPSYQQALLLYTQYGYSYAQIACMVGIAPSSVKMLLSRARHRFKEHYLALGQEVTCV